jgi:hypothetical protein
MLRARIAHGRGGLEYFFNIVASAKPGRIMNGLIVGTDHHRRRTFLRSLPRKGQQHCDHAHR